jgi:hypothetical protein
MSTPHLAFPLNFANGHARTVEQDSGPDQRQRAIVVLSYPQGFAIDLPEFGTPDTTFGQNGADLGVLEAVLAEWEPDIPASAVRVLIDEQGTDTIRMNLGG